MKKFKNYLALCLAMGITITNVYAAGITDVASNHWAYTAISDVQEKGILSLNSKGEFKPNEQMNYFEFMIAFARATGYKNPAVDTTIEPTLKEAIIKNQEKQMPTINTYAEKYPAWDKLANESIAYLLGRGYITSTDLDKFIVTNTTGASVKKMLTKQDLATYIVRMLQKEETAKTEFVKTGKTGFTDENLITTANKANVAYLKTLGLVSGDGSNLFGPNAYVTRSVCAKMLSEGLQKKGETTNSNKEEVTTPNEESTAVTGAVLTKVLEKNSTEYYVLIEKDGKTKFYTMKKDLSIKTATGTTTIDKIALKTTIDTQIEVQNSVEYIVQVKVGSSVTVDTNGTTNTPNTPQTLIEGTLERVGSNNDLSFTDKNNKFSTYMMSDTVKIVSSGQTIKAEDLKVGSTIRVTLSGDTVVQVEVIQDLTANGKIQGEIEKKVISKNNIIVTVKSLNKTVDVTIPSKVKMTRNSKAIDFLELRVGDNITISNKDGGVSSVEATSTVGKSTGKVKSILLAARPTITIETTAGDKTFSVTPETEIYDNNTRSNTLLGSLKLGQEVELMVDSKEILSVVIQEGNAKLNYKATIESVGKGNKTIDVLVEYDPLTEESMAFKRITIPVEVKISRNGVDEHRSILKEGMELIITFDGYQDFTPEKVLILN